MNLPGKDSALARLKRHQREDFEAMLEAMDGRPVTIRLLDPPLHEFLPSSGEDLDALVSSIHAELGIPADAIRERLAGLKEVNPMMGLRGCRLGIVYPEITIMQVGPSIRFIPFHLISLFTHARNTLTYLDTHAHIHTQTQSCNIYIYVETNVGIFVLIFIDSPLICPPRPSAQVHAITEAACSLRARGLDPRPQIMVPLPAFAEELAHQIHLVRDTMHEVMQRAGTEVDIK